MRSLMLLAAGAAVLLVGPPAPGQNETAETSKASPAAVFDLVRQAQAKAAAKEWAAAAALLERVVRLNPVRPDYWTALGRVRYLAKDYKGAVPAYERAAELG